MSKVDMLAMLGVLNDALKGPNTRARRAVAHVAWEMLPKKLISAICPRLHEKGWGRTGADRSGGRTGAGASGVAGGRVFGLASRDGAW